MTENQYSLFKKFQSVEIAKDFAEFLKENSIDYQLVDNSPPVDITFSHGTLQNEVQVLVRQSDFERANHLLESNAEELTSRVEKDHYLFAFSNEELYEILLKPDEWSSFDYKLSQRILKERGQTVDNDLIKSLREQRIKDLSRPEPNQSSWVLFGYFLAIAGGLLGLFIGWFLWNHKKTLPNGEKIFAYREQDRLHGKRIFFIGIPLMIFWILLRFYIEYNN